MTTTSSFSSIEELKELDLNGKLVYVCGVPASGKTHTSIVIHPVGGYVIHTDFYKDDPIEEVLSKIMLATRKYNTVIVEGVMCYELLLSVVKGWDSKPDIIVYLDIPRSKQEEIYRKERDPRKIKYMRGFNMKLLKMWNEYLRLIEDKEIKPQIITFNNQWG